MEKSRNFRNYRIPLYSGFTLLELIITIAITSIVATGVAALVTTSVKMINQTNILKIPQNNSRVILNILNQDLLVNTGKLNIQTTNTNTTLGFTTLNLNEADAYNSINYTCDYNSKTFYRQINLNSPEILINNINFCDFSTNIATNQINISIFTKINFTTHDNEPRTLYEVFNAPYND